MLGRRHLRLVGGGCAYWGIHDLRVLIRLLSNGAPIIGTQSAMPGLPLMGVAPFAIGALFLIPAASTDKFRCIRNVLHSSMLGPERRRIAAWGRRSQGPSLIEDHASRAGFIAVT